jgi:calcineurin-like phosphoesterase family protein
MKNIFLISDTHFGHDRIRIHCNRPWHTIEEHDEALITNWNNVVKRGDIIYHLGDFAMIPKQDDGTPRMKLYRKLRMRLNGKIILIKGNHDQMAEAVYKECFSEVYDLREIKINGEKIVLCHYPLRSWNAAFHGRKHIFGHVHGRLERVDTGVSCDVGVDVPDWNYAPAPIEVVLDKLNIKYKKIKEINKYNRSYD